MRRRLGLVVALVVAVGAGVTVASALVPQGTDTVGGPHDVQPDGGAVVVGATASDPAGGPPWAVRVYHSQSGWTCPELGRVVRGEFGRVDADGTFTALPVEAAGACADLTSAPVALAVMTSADPPRAVVFGALSPRVDDVGVRGPDGLRAVARDATTFVAVLPGTDLAGWTVEVTAGGTLTRQSLGE